jgi:ribose transport system substrate-binding protein
MQLLKTLKAGAVSLSVAAAMLTGNAYAQAKEPPYKIYLSMSYIGNDWQAESANMLKAMAMHKSMRDKVDLRVQVAGASAQKQIQQINAMVAAGADAIIMYAVSETLLNSAVKNACDKGVIVFTYDSPITEPCAYQTTIDQVALGRETAEWLAKAMNYKGNAVLVTGVPGTSVDTTRTREAKAVFAKYPDIKIVAEVNGMWSQAVARAELSKVLATYPWESINGLWMQVGCFTAASMQDEAGIPDDKKIPCAGEGSNGHRLQMLPAGTEVEGASGTYRPMGYPSISIASPTYEGGLALKLAVKLLEGGDVPHLTVVPLPNYTNDQIVMCKEGTWQEMKEEGCNVFSPLLVPNPGWFSSIYSEETPEIGLAAALTGEPEE